ncbi:MAG: redox-sensing transcriptional repressor Rex [Ruminococcaceae bacterium]|nr:redox-sensing transcriptional repressor Rex [Oscillospiraceae bacterium]
MPKNGKISNSVIRRLPRYYRFLGELQEEGITKISSGELSQRMKLTASQIRQDLNCFGGFGQQGYGYNVSELREEIGAIIGIDKRLNAILVGAGNLGKAVALHLNFENCGCKLIGVFDSNPDLSNNALGDMKILSTSLLESFCKNSKPQIAILCIPKESAKELCDKLLGLGIRSFWNFSHYDLNLEYEDEDIIVENVHLGDSLLTLTYRTNNK